jgi:hypothetical protein
MSLVNGPIATHSSPVAQAQLTNRLCSDVDHLSHFGIGSRDLDRRRKGIIDFHAEIRNIVVKLIPPEHETIQQGAGAAK